MRRQVSSGWRGDDEGRLKGPLWRQVADGHWVWGRQMQGGLLGGGRRAADEEMEEHLDGGGATGFCRLWCDLFSAVSVVVFL